MTIIHSAKDWDEFFYYKPSKPSKYPTCYPCIADRITEGGGLAGEYEAHYVIYIPKEFKSIVDAVLYGIRAPWEFIC